MPKLFIINKDGWGFGGGYSFLVCANSKKEAREIVINIDDNASDFFTKYPTFEISDECEIGELKNGEFVRLSYYE